MREVTIRLRFNRECLGAVKQRRRGGQVIFAMLRDSSERVMFLPSWWHSLMKYATRVVNRCPSLVKDIAWDPLIDCGNVAIFQRTVVESRDDRNGRRRYALHEAFTPGTVVGVNAVLPSGMGVDGFHELLSAAGTYRGISPFQDNEATYGTFEVISIHPSVRGQSAAALSAEQADWPPPTELANEPSKEK